MTIQQIRYFLCLAQHLNYHRAADALFITQPTLTRQIQLLEDELGFPLLSRNNRSVSLTPAGQTMYESFARALEQIEDGTTRARQLMEGTSGTLNIGYLEGLDTSHYIMPPTIHFTKQYPNVDISMEMRSFAELRKKLDEGALDIVFTLDFELAEYKAVKYEVCYPATAVILMSKNHPLADKPCTPADFSQETFILPSPLDSPGRAEELKRIFARLGVAIDHIRFVPNLESVFVNVRAGNGVTIHDSTMARIYEDHYRYVALPSDKAPLSLCAVYKKANENPVIPLYIKTLLNKDTIDVFYN